MRYSWASSVIVVSSAFALAISSSVLICTVLYFFIPVPAGISVPIITFSFSPINSSVFPFIAASVSTLVVSWNDAADKKLSVASDAFVIPSNTLFPVAGLRPFCTAS